MDNDTPIQENKRLPWIDAARGMALFGILMVNVPAFNAPFFLYGGEEVFFGDSISRSIHTIVDIFFQASFYTLFSFLFGFGMQMMRERLSHLPIPYWVVIGRRLMALFGFGVLHAFLLWHGDILLSYAIVGCLLFFFYNQSAKTVLLWFFVLLIVPALYITERYYSIKEFIGWVNYDAISQSFQNYKSESIADVLYQNYSDWMYNNWGVLSFVFLVMIILPMFLAGMFFMKKKWLHHIEVHRKKLRVILIVAFIVFLVFKAGPYLFGNPLWFGFMQDQIGGAASSIFYIVFITLLFQYPFWKKLLNGLTYIGRMSFTNYISQSIICFILFYGPGFNLYGSVTPLWSVLIVIAIFSVQVVWSKWWLTHFRFGPLEWVWRSVTYWKKQPIKKRQTDSI